MNTHIANMRPFVTKFRSIEWDLPSGPWHTYVLDYAKPRACEQVAAARIQETFRMARKRRHRRQVIRRLYIDMQIKKAQLQDKITMRANLVKDHCTMCIVSPKRFVLLMRPQRDTVEGLYGAVADVYGKPGFYLTVQGTRIRQSKKKLYKVGFNAGSMFMVRICH